MPTVRLSVKGMTCGHCRMAVTNALRSVAGVSAVEVDLAAGLATVTFDAPATVEQLQAAVAEEGYEVVGVSQA